MIPNPMEILFLGLRNDIKFAIFYQILGTRMAVLKLSMALLKLCRGCTERAGAKF